MDIKSEKTFEEVVERLVALSDPQLETSCGDAAPPSSTPRLNALPSAAPISTPAEDDTK